MRRAQSGLGCRGPLPLACGLILLSLVCVAESAPRLDLLGGPRGVVRSAQGFPLEGIMIQLISEKTAIRTTVYSNYLGQYEFPKMEPGLYTLRTPRPLEYRRYVKELVQIKGEDKLGDIVLRKVSEEEFLPPTPDILSQLSDAEWLLNLPGSGYEKKVFSNQCGPGCHSYQMPFRSRFDERSWRLILDRMMAYGSRLLDERSPLTPTEEKDTATLAKWLARVRGPDAVDPPLKVFPRPQGPATRAVITEYELPWVGAIIHDVYGAPDGSIWFNTNRSPFIGKLDPKSGKITSYRTPLTEGKHPGGHWLEVDNDGIVWYSENWADNLVRFDPKTAAFRVMRSVAAHNNALSHADGTLWRSNRGRVVRIDKETGQIAEAYPLQRIKGQAYGNFISWDGRYVGGGNRNADFDGIFWFDRQTKEIREIPSPSGACACSRGSFDPDGNIWVGGRGGVIVKYDPQNHVVAEYAAPTPYQTYYETRADKNGEVWAGEMRGGRIARFNPRTGHWIEYVLPEPFSFDWKTYVDNSTDPVTVWYGDQYGYIVRIQPME